MRLTVYTDYSLRLLMYIAMHQGKLCTIEEVSKAYNISKNHLMKVAHELGLKGFIEAVRGRGGGLRLAKPASEIRVGDVVRMTEPDFTLVECFDHQKNRCVITPACRLISVIAEAERAFLLSLNRYTIAEMVVEPQKLKRLLIPTLEV